MKNKKSIIGISGYIGSGKTTAGKFLEKLGACFIDADEVVNNLYRIGAPGYKRIQSFLGDEFIKKNGEIDRKKLAKFVFRDKNKLKILNNLIHPLVFSEVKRLIDRAKCKVVVLEATYFKKKSLGSLVTGIVWIDCPLNMIKKRAVKEREVDKGLLKHILEIQEKPDKIDVEVKNCLGKKALFAGLKKVWPFLTGD